MSAGANVRHLTGLLLAAVGGLFGLGMAAVFALLGAVNGEPGGFVCSALSVVIAAVCVWRGVRMRNRAARESTLFKDEITPGTRTSVTGKGKSPRGRERKPGDDDW